MTCTPVPGIRGIVCANDEHTFSLVDAKGKAWSFEEGNYGGPMALTKRGGIAAQQPGSRSPFWPAYELWREQGRRVGESGRCLWLQPPREKVQHLGGNNYLVVHDDETRAADEAFAKALKEQR